MLRRDSSFRISKQTKRWLAQFVDADMRRTLKEAMIGAQIEASKVFVKKGKDTDES